MARRRSRDQDPDSIHVPFDDAVPGDGEMALADIDEFIIPSRDDKGGQVTITISIPPILDRQIEVLLSSRRFPYATKRDLVRHAIARHSVFLLSCRQSIPKHVQAMCEAVIELCRDDDTARKMEQVFEVLRHRVETHVANNDHMEAVGLISQVNQMLLQLKPSAWVRKFETRFRDQFGGYLRVQIKKAKEAQAQARAGSEE